MYKQSSRQGTVSGIITMLSGIALIVAGCLYLYLPEIAYASQFEAPRMQQAAMVNTTPATSMPSIAQPDRIRIDRLRIDLAIKPGVYDAATQTWTLDNENTFFMSPEVTRTPVIYGHNIDEVFRPLNAAAIGDDMELVNGDGSVLLFRFTGDKVVDPTDVSVLQAELPNSIRLMTCSGVWFEDRRLLTFEFVRVKSGGN